MTQWPLDEYHWLSQHSQQYPWQHLTLSDTVTSGSVSYHNTHIRIHGNNLPRVTQWPLDQYHWLSQPSQQYQWQQLTLSDKVTSGSVSLTITTHTAVSMASTNLERHSDLWISIIDYHNPHNSIHGDNLPWVIQWPLDQYHWLSQHTQQYPWQQLTLSGTVTSGSVSLTITTLTAVSMATTYPEWYSDLWISFIDY